MDISIYITSYNQKRYLAEAIESSLAQTLKPSQIVIVDDCSTDGSGGVIASFHSQYEKLILPIYHSQNTGVAQTRIDALKAVTGDYVTYVDGDDRLLPTKLEKEARLLQENPEAGIAFSNVYYIDDQGARIGTWADEVKPPEGYVFCETFARDFPKWNLFRCELVDYRAWKQIGFYDPNLHVYEDFDMRIRLTKRLPIVYCDEPQSEYRLHQAGLSRGRLTQHFDALDYIYKKNLALLSDLSESQRDYVTRRFGEWMATVAVRGAAQFLSEWQAGQACRLLLAAMRYDPAMFVRPSLARALAPRALRKRISPLRRMWAKLATKQG